MAMGLFVAYYRVSTAEQARSGLGIDAQKEAVSRHLNGGVWELIGEYEENESGTKNDRPVLRNALNHCKRTGATLIIARLDRLSRNSAFITALMESKAKFVCCDMPEATEFTITIMAALAAVEAKRISSNTKAALAAKKEFYKTNTEALKSEGKRYCLGNNNLTENGKKDGSKRSAAVRAAQAADHATLVSPRIKELKGEGLSLREIADKLSDERYEAPRKGKAWTAVAVKRILDKEMTPLTMIKVNAQWAIAISD